MVTQGANLELVGVLIDHQIIGQWHQHRGDDDGEQVKEGNARLQRGQPEPHGLGSIRI